MSIKYFLTALFLFTQIINVNASRTLSYKETLGCALNNPTGIKDYKVESTKSLPILDNLASLDPTTFTPVNHSRWSEFGAPPLPPAKSFHFAFEYTAFTPTRLWPMELAQLGAIEDMQDPYNVRFKPGRDEFHNFMVELSKISGGPLNIMNGIHPNPMACKLFVPKKFDASTGDKLKTVILVCGTTGHRLSEEIMAGQFTVKGVAVAIVDPVPARKGHDHLGRSLLGEGGAILRLHRLLETCPFLDATKPAAFGDSLGGLVLWLSQQHQIYSRYGYVEPPYCALATANMPPVITFKETHQKPHTIPWAVFHGTEDTFVPIKSVQNWHETFGKSNPFKLNPVKGAVHDFLTHPADGESPNKDVRTFPTVLITKTADQGFEELNSKFLEARATLQDIISKGGDPSPLFTNICNPYNCIAVLHAHKKDEKEKDGYFMKAYSEDKGGFTHKELSDNLNNSGIQCPFGPAPNHVQLRYIIIANLVAVLNGKTPDTMYFSKVK